jgi:hypothetical protein
VILTVQLCGMRLDVSGRFRPNGGDDTCIRVAIRVDARYGPSPTMETRQIDLTKIPPQRSKQSKYRKPHRPIQQTQYPSSSPASQDHKDDNYYLPSGVYLFPSFTLSFRAPHRHSVLSCNDSETLRSDCGVFSQILVPVRLAFPVRN